VVEVGQRTLAVQRLAGQVPQLLDRPIGEAYPAVAAEVLDERQVVVLARIEGLRVGRPDVVALEHAFGDDLPIHRNLRTGRPDQAPLRAEQVRDLAQLVLGVCPSFLGDEHDAAPLHRRHRDEAVRRLVEPGKAVRVRHAP